MFKPGMSFFQEKNIENYCPLRFKRDIPGGDICVSQGCPYDKIGIYLGISQGYVMDIHVPPW